jgi:uncharacterized protein YraI
LGCPECRTGIHPISAEPHTTEDENMNLRNRPVRLVAAVGAVVAAGTTTFMALAAGTASADEPGHCLQNVNIREEPNATSRIVALCEAGTQVMLGAERDGWVELDALGGWASKDFVKADEQPSSDAHDADSSDHASGTGSSDDHASSDHPSGDHSSSDPADDADHHDADHGSEQHGPGDRSTDTSGDEVRSLLGG